MAEPNPYQPPASFVEDVAPRESDGRSFIIGGRAVNAGQGWTWLTEAFALFKKQAGMWILILIVVAAIVIVASLIPLIGWILPSLLIPGLSAGVILGCKALDEGDRLTVGHVFAAFKRKGSALLLLGGAGFVLYMVAMIPFMVVMGGSFVAMMSGDPSAFARVGADLPLAVLLTMAISIPVYMAMWFAPALVTLHDEPPLAALRLSFLACLKNIIPFLVYGIIVLVLAVIAVLPIGLGMLVLLPVIFASVYTAYRSIFFEG